MLALIASALFASPLGYTAWTEFPSLGWVETDAPWRTMGTIQPTRFDFEEPAGTVLIGFRWGRDFPSDIFVGTFTTYDGAGNALESLEYVRWPRSLASDEDYLYFDSSCTPIASLIIRSGDDSVIDTFSVRAGPVPEPATLALVALGMAAMGWRRLRARG